MRHNKPYKREEDEIIVLWDNKGPKEVCDFIDKFGNSQLKKDQYLHLDYGGNDGSVASEIAKILQLDKPQIYSADIEKWLGNPMGLESQALEWIEYAELGNIEQKISPVLPAALPIIQKLQSILAI